MSKKKYYFEDPVARGLVQALGTKKARRNMSYFIGNMTFFGDRIIKDQFKTLLSFLSKKKKAFIVTGKTTIKLCKTIEKVLNRAKFEYKIWNDIEAVLPIENIKKGVEALNEFEADLIIAVGGGSVLDTAKGIWILYERPDIDLYDVQPLVPIKLSKVKFVAIPTSSGSGSEATSATVLSDTSFSPPRKVSIISLETVPHVTILETSMVQTMPPKLVVGSGFDALSHATNAYLTHFSTPYSEAFALKAIKLIFEYLERSYKDPEDLDAKYYMHIASNMAAFATSNSAPGIDHAFAHTMELIFKTHHGLGCGIFAPYCLQYIAKTSKKYLDLAKDLGIQANSNEEYLDKLVKKYQELMKKVHAPLTIKEWGIDEKEFKEKLPLLAETAFNDGASWFSPRPEYDLDACKKIFEYAYDGKKVDF
ncbi:MAG: iron-containing alcohol dehydrogenase [Candidatus Hodarchaeota archaeon]